MVLRLRAVLHRYHPIARQMWAFTLVGAIAFLLLLGPVVMTGRLSALEVFLLLTILVIVPLALALCTHPLFEGAQTVYLRLTIWAYPFAAVLGVISVFLPTGSLAAFLAVPWLLVTALAAVHGFSRFWRRGFASMEELAIDFGLLYLPLAGFWFVSYRLAARPLGVSPLIVLLAAVHFANAGFSALFLTGLAGRWLSRRGHTYLRDALLFTTAAGLICPILVSFGIAYSWKLLELGSAYAMEAGYFLLSLIMLFVIVPRIRERLPKYLLAISGVGLFLGMCLAVTYTLRIFDIPRMIHSHAYVMSMLVCTCGLLGWLLLGPIAARQPKRDPAFIQAINECAVIPYGLFVGQMLLTATLVVFWRRQPPAEFLSWFSRNLSLMNTALMPLGAAAGLGVMAALFAARNDPVRRVWLGVSTVCWMLMIATFPVFFAFVNAQLATPGATSDSEVARLLLSWEYWHWARLLLGLAGFYSLIHAVRLLGAPRHPKESPPRVRNLIAELATMVYGLFAGTLCLTLVLLITWKSMQPAEFTAWFSANAARTGNLLMPLAALTGVLTFLALFVGQRGPKTRIAWLAIAFMCWLGIFLENPFFFSHANQLLATPGALAEAEIRPLLSQWEYWHWARLALSLAGLYALAHALRLPSPALVPDPAPAAIADDEKISIPGAFVSFDQAVDSLRLLEERFLRERDRRGVFATAYLTMLDEMKRGLADGLFKDRTWITSYSLALANLYREALEAYEAGDVKAVPICWRIAFDAARNKVELVSQDLLLALNAHINHDHVAGLLRVSIEENRSAKYLDYLAVNEVLQASTKPVSERVAEYAPGLAIVDKMLGPLDLLLTNYQMEKARDAAWRAAVAQTTAPTLQERQRLQAELGEHTGETARLLLKPNADYPWVLRVLRLLEGTSAVEEPPGGLGLPWLGQSLQFAKDPSGFLQKRFEQFGSVFKLRLLGSKMICMVGPDAFKLLASERHFQREGANPRHWRRLMNWDPSPLIDGPKRSRRKHLVLQAFTRQRLDDYLPIIESIYQAYLASWERQERFSWLAEFKTLSLAVSEALYLGAAATPRNAADLLLIERLYAGFSSIPIQLPFTTYGRALKARDELIAAIERAVQAHRETQATDVLGNLMAARDEHGEGLNLHELDAEIQQFFFASYGAMYATLSCLVIALAQYEEPRRRALAEVKLHAPEGPVTLKVLEKLEYVDRFAREVRRFYPLTATTLFATVKQGFTYNGYYVPADWKAIGFINGTMHEPKTFRDPESFDPDRFSPERRDGQRLPEGYVAHGGGSPEGHRCAGEPLADMHLNLAIVLLLRDYTWEFPPQDLNLDPSHGVPFPKDGLQVVFRRTRLS